MRNGHRIGAQRPQVVRLPEGVASLDAGRDACAFAASVGIVLDDWQQWLVQQLLAERADGSLAASTGIVLVSRQNGKNVVLAAIELYGLCIAGLRRQVHSAHRGDTAAEHMKFLRDVIRADESLDADQGGYLRVYESNGKERIVNVETWGELSFNTRSASTKRGASPQRIILDEAMILSEGSLQALVPSLAAQSMAVETSPQIIVTSSAPLADSVVLHRLRRAALDGGSGRTFLADWGCPVGTDPDDREAWYASNPGLGVRISQEWVAEERSTMLSEEAFLIERLGVVFPPVTSGPRLIAEDVWLANVTDEPAGVPVAFGVDVTPDRSTAAIGAVSLVDGVAHVGVVDHRPGGGVGWIEGRVAELRQSVPGAVWVVDGRGQANGLVSDPVSVLSAREMAQACGALFSAVSEGTVRYRRSSILEAAVEVAAARPLGDAWAWDKRGASGDISPLVAVTLALHGASRVPAEPLLFSY